MALFQSPLCTTLGSTEADPLGELNRSLRWQERQQQQRSQAGDNIGRNSSTCTQVVWIFFWLLVLILLAYPLALLAALLYALLNPLNLLTCCQAALRHLLAILNLPLTCARNMVEAKQLIIM